MHSHCSCMWPFLFKTAPLAFMSAPVLAAEKRILCVSHIDGRQLLQRNAFFLCRALVALLRRDPIRDRIRFLA
ncbi:hypothetical protein EDD85DRAFT_810098 [Armillaria nabsnona]|nr:hypothetical protein EDD85DRAFT_810098 [Armillaria nabsnona]